MIKNLLVFFELLLLVVLIDPADHNSTPLSREFRLLINLRGEHVLILIIEPIFVLGILISYLKLLLTILLLDRWSSARFFHRIF